MQHASLTLLTLALLLSGICPRALSQGGIGREAVDVAASEIARLAAADLAAAPGVPNYRALAVVPRGGNASEPMAMAMAGALRTSGHGLNTWDRAEEVCRNSGVSWATDEPLSVRQQALVMEGLGADGVILVRAQADPLGPTEIQMVAQMTLADPAQLGFPWSFEAEATAQPPQRGSRSLWQEHPEWIIGAIVLLVLAWGVGAIRKRRA